MQVIEQKRKLQQPRSDRQILAEAQEAFEKARTAFRAAFRRQDGAEHAEGQAFLDGADQQIKRLRKKVKEY